MKLISVYEWLLRKMLNLSLQVRSKKNKRVLQMVEVLEDTKKDIDCKIMKLKSHLD